MKTSSYDIPSYLKFSIAIVGICAFGFFLYVSQEILMPICFSVLLAILMDPLVVQFQRIKIPRIIAILLTVFLSGIFVLATLYLIADQITSFNESLPNIKQKLSEVLDQGKVWISTRLHVKGEAIDSYFDNWSKGLLDEGGAMIGYTIAAVTSMVVVWLLIPIYVAMLLYYQSLILLVLEKATDKESHGKIIEVMSAVRAMVQSYLIGLFFEAIIVAILNTAGLMILGIDYAILLGVVSAVLNMIPYIGGVVAVILPVLVAIATMDSLWSPVLVMGLYGLTQAIDNNVIIPLIVASRVKINAFASVTMVIIFGTMFGLFGMFLALPITAVVKIICDRIENLKPYGLLLGYDLPVESKFGNILKKFKRT